MDFFTLQVWCCERIYPSPCLRESLAGKNKDAVCVCPSPLQQAKITSCEE
jgi:hypothetical protein